jgi:hypothetical protein
MWIAMMNGKKNVLDIFTLVGGGTPKTSVAEYWTDEIPCFRRRYFSSSSRLSV